MICGNIKIGSDGEIIFTYIPSRSDDGVAYYLCWNIGTFLMLVALEEVFRVVGGVNEALGRREGQRFLPRIVQNFGFDIVDKSLVRKYIGRDNYLRQN